MEKVYTVTDYYDGPRRGVADFVAIPHAYELLFDDSEDEWEAHFSFGPVDQYTPIYFEPCDGGLADAEAMEKGI